MKIICRALAACLILVVAGSAPPAGAQDRPDEAPATVPEDDPREWLRTLDRIELEVGARHSLTSERISELAAEISALQRAAQAALASRGQRTDPLKRELESLGPAPAEGEPPESEEEQVQRQGVLERFATNETQIRLSRLSLVRAENLQSRLAQIESWRFTRETLLRRSPSLLQAETWTAALATARRVADAVGAAPRRWLDRGEGLLIGHPLFAFGGVAVVALLTLSVRRRLRAWNDGLQSRLEAAHTSRILIAFLTTVAETLLPVLSLGAGAVLINAFGVREALTTSLVYYCVTGAIIYFLTAGLAFAVLQPQRPAWRLLDVDDHAAAILYRRLRLVALAFSTAFLVIRVSIAAGVESRASPQYFTVVAFLLSSVCVALLFSILPSRFVRDAEGRPHPAALALSVAMALLLAAVPALYLAGFGNLAGNLLFRYLIVTTTIVGFAFLLRAALGEALGWLTDPKRGLRQRLVAAGGTSAELPPLTRLALGLTADLAVYGPMLWLLLFFYGVPEARLNLWLEGLLTGVTIGNVTISPIDIVVAILLFSGVLIAASIVRRWLAHQLSDSARIDVGLKNALLAGVGYVGVILAVVVAIAALGLDLSNFALVASALSVGIGFGLRTVVENFVAGLLLLIERPIKEGDWIVTGGRDGIVRKISVRSTEVETFDRSTIVVPNSELIGQSVENWSHRNRLARGIVAVGVAYGSDTKQVRDILLDCVRAQQDVVAYPPPQVLFLEFGDSSLNFEVRFFVRDTDYLLATKSDLHFAIEEAFRTAGIEIPFPQRVVHMARETPQRADDPDADAETAPAAAPAALAKEPGAGA